MFLKIWIVESVYVLSGETRWWEIQGDTGDQVKLISLTGDTTNLHQSVRKSTSSEEVSDTWPGSDTCHPLPKTFMNIDCPTFSLLRRINLKVVIIIPRKPGKLKEVPDHCELQQLVRHKSSLKAAQHQIFYNSQGGKKIWSMSLKLGLNGDNNLQFTILNDLL